LKWNGHEVGCTTCLGEESRRGVGWYEEKYRFIVPPRMSLEDCVLEVTAWDTGGKDRLPAADLGVPVSMKATRGVVGQTLLSSLLRLMHMHTAFVADCLLHP